MPLQLARMTGCISGTSTQIGRLFDLDIPAASAHTKLTRRDGQK
jgi:phosphoribosyl-dephospho-CoA transferase